MLAENPGVSQNEENSKGIYSKSEKERFYRMARRSATECAAIFDVCNRLNLIEDMRHVKGREVLLRIVAMLTKMVQN